MPTRRRMTPAQRRAQLLDVGEAIFDEGRFEELSMDEIAGRAGVTRALLYHYFTSKADYFAAIWQRAHESLRGISEPSPDATVRAWAADRLAAYLDFYARHPHLVYIANRSSVSTDPTVREPVSAHFRSMGKLLLDAAGCAGAERAIAEAAFDGWIAFVRATALAAFVEQTITPAQTLSLSLAALDATVGRHADLGTRPKRRPA
ncbi:TetR/AcrR family transcriptional regulator [Flexivirga endophytica]|nr:TetR/AcrR family transcriptional regulator [Flexivirga endophytica]